MEETKEERVQSPESVSSHSFSSLDEGRADSASPDNRGEERGEQQGTGERESDSEGECQWLISLLLHVVNTCTCTCRQRLRVCGGVSKSQSL